MRCKDLCFLQKHQKLKPSCSGAFVPKTEGNKNNFSSYTHTGHRHFYYSHFRLGLFLMLEQMGQLYFLRGSLAQTHIPFLHKKQNVLLMKKKSNALVSKLTENRFLKVINGWPKDHKSTGTTKSCTFPCGPLYCQLIAKPVISQPSP